MDGRMCDELQDYFDGLATRHSTRVVVLRGAGRAFCAGFDLKAPQEVSAGPACGMRAQRRVSEIILRMQRCSLEAALALEDRGQILCASAGYFEEGIAAFLEGRAPSYPDE
jgi:enoyl-CoA hydratase/carnithine racemase